MDRGFKFLLIDQRRHTCIAVTGKTIIIRQGLSLQERVVEESLRIASAWCKKQAQDKYKIFKNCRNILYIILIYKYNGVISRTTQILSKNT